MKDNTCSTVYSSAPHSPSRITSHTHGWRTIFKVGGRRARQKNYRKFLRFELATVTSQVLKYDVITYTPYEGIKYTTLDKITPL